MLSLISLLLLVAAIIAEVILAMLWLVGLEQDAMIQVLRRVIVDAALAMFLLVFLLRQPRARPQIGPRLFPHSLKAYLES